MKYNWNAAVFLIWTRPEGKYFLTSHKWMSKLGRIYWHIVFVFLVEPPLKTNAINWVDLHFEGYFNSCSRKEATPLFLQRRLWTLYFSPILLDSFSWSLSITNFMSGYSTAFHIWYRWLVSNFLLRFY